MKKKKLLESPIVVVLLCVVAGAAIYFNAVAPMLKKDSPDAEAADETLPVIADDVQSVLEPLPETTADPAAVVSDTSMVSDLHRIGWIRTGSRNPFVLVDTSRTQLPEVNVADSTTDSASAKQVRSKARSARSKTAASGSRAAKKSSLLAISRGKSGLVALIGTQIVRVGDTCEEGVVQSIDRTSVTLHTPAGPRILRLTTSNQGAAQ